MQVNLATQEDLANLVKRIDELEKELTLHRELIIENGDMVSTKEAIRMTGIADARTLKKRISGWVQKGTGPITWPKSTIIEYISQNAIAA